MSGHEHAVANCANACRGRTNLAFYFQQKLLRHCCCFRQLGFMSKCIFVKENLIEFKCAKSWLKIGVLE